MTSLLFTSLFSKVAAQNKFNFVVDPKHATTLFVELDGTLRVETWNEAYVFIQIEVETATGTKETIRFLEENKQAIIQQEFTVNDFLLLTILDPEKWLQLEDCDPATLFHYTLKAPKYLDLELRCKNDMVVHDPLEENRPVYIEKFNVRDDK